MGSKRFLLIFIIFALTGCLGDKQKPPEPTDSASLSGMTLLRYNVNKATLQIRGTLLLEAMTPLNVVHFHLQSDCSDSPVGRGLQEDFIAGGIQAEVPASIASKIYVSSNTIIGCYYIATFSPNYVAPPRPVLTSTSPSSPSRNITNPSLFGTASGYAALLDFYDDSLCTNLVGTGTSADFAGIGISINVTPNQTTRIFAIATEPFGKPSPCEEIGTYRHSTSGPPTAVYVSSNPPSPGSSSTTPRIKGTTSASTQTIKIFRDPACLVEVASGTKADFEDQGLAITVGMNAVTYVYAVAIDTDGDSSSCGYLTSYVHDNVAPATPTYVSVNPVSPTASTLYPRIRGLSSADTATIKIYSSVACVTPIGSGTKTEFELTGVLSTVIPNNTTSIYASSLDIAGNASACVLMTDFTHDTLPPEPPSAGTSTPLSPNNQSTTPTISGNTPADAVSVRLYSDEACSVQIGSGTALQYTTSGISTSVPGNATTTIFGTAIDHVGNVSSCAEQTVYAHSTNPAPAPTFLQTIPSSPSRTSFTPSVIGSAPNIVASVRIFGDPACTNQLGSASRVQFSTIGATVTLAPNSIYELYAKSLDIYGNDSPCTLFTTYTHANIPPLNPTFSSTDPASPNNVTATPLVKGSTFLNPASVLPPDNVSIYDSFLCLNRVGQGSTTDFASTGLESVLTPNLTTTLYSRVFDAAGNQSACTFMADYTYVNIKPGRPLFLSSSPSSPSYTNKTNVVGTLAASTNILPVASVRLFSDSNCTNMLTSGSQSQFQTTGISVNMFSNSTTPLFGNSIDPVGNVSLCNSLMNFVHSDAPPGNLVATARPDGSVGLNWNPDMIANPSPRYIIKRSLVSGGPYTILTSNNLGTSYIDKMVTNSANYFYVVASTNITGTSLNSLEASVAVLPPNPSAVASLVASSGDGVVDLSWTGFNSNMAFSIYRSTQRGGPYTLLASELTAMNYVDSAVTINTPYYYTVVGLNPAGQSQNSNEASATPLGAPEAPTDLQLTQLLSSPACSGGSGLLLTWSSPNYYTQFSIKRGRTTGSRGNYATAGTNWYTDCNPESYAGTGLSVNYYAVTAVWGSSESAASNEVSFVHEAQPVLTVRPGDGEALLTWTNPNNADSFRILRSQKSGGPYSVLVASTTTGFYVDTTVTNGQPYFYVIESFYGGLITWPSIEQGGTPGASPANPTNLILSVDANKKPSLAWIAPANFNSFNIHRATTAGGPYSLISTANSRQFTDVSPLAGLNYYRISANWGNSQSGFSNTVSFRHGVPASLTATPVASDISLTWPAVPTATDYNVFRSLTSGGPYTQISTVASANFTDTTTAPTIGYFYVVSANFSDSTVGQLSPQASAMESGTDVPSGLTVTATTAGTVSLAWAKVSGATTYRVTRSTSAGGTYTQVATNIASTSVVLGSVLSQTTYYFRVIAVVGGNPSSPSDYVAATTLTPPSAPAVAAGNNSVFLQWSSVVGALAYAVERSSDGINYATVDTGLASVTYTDNTAINGNLYFYRIRVNYTLGGDFASGASSPVIPGVTPMTPAPISVVENSTGVGLIVAWAPVPTATAYRLYLSTSSGGPYGAPALTTASTSGVSVTGLTADTTYYLAISAVNGSIESGLSAETAVHTLAQPPAPSVLAASATSFNVSWGSVAGAATYDLQRSDDGSLFYNIATGLATTNYLDTTVSAPNSYSYRYLPIRAGGVPMAVSNSSGLASSGVAPLAPPQLQAYADSSSTVSLNWVQVPIATQYRIYRGTSMGGPYTLVDTVPSTTTYYLDSTVMAGNAYYYVVTSLNISSAESVYSNEQFVSTSAGPATLSASIGTNSNDLSWSAVGGAVSYIVRRSETAGGPYGTIATGVTGVTAQDANVLHGRIYYYVVHAVFAGDVVSIASPEAVATAVNTMNLQVPIELTDQSISSTVAPITFERTRTSFNTADYDGSVTYFMEAVVANYDSVPRSLYLVNGSNTAVSSIDVPANTTAPTRIRVTATPTTGYDTYRLQLSATADTGYLQVFSARLLVNQVGASRTKLYFPLLSSSALPNELDLQGATHSSQSTTYDSLPSAGIFRRDVSQFSRIADYNAWTLETLVAAGTGAAGSVALMNFNLSTVVLGTESEFNNTGVALVQSPFDEGIAGFSSSNNGHEYQISIKCRVNCQSETVGIYKAGLWLALHDLSKTQVVYRNSVAVSFASNPGVIEGARVSLDLGSFSNPSVFHYAVGNLQMGTNSATVSVNTDGTNDSGSSQLTPVANSTLSFSSTTKSLMTSPALSIGAGSRILPSFNPDTSSFQLNNSSIVIRATR